MESAGGWGRKANNLDGGREEYAAANYVGSNKVKTLTFETGTEYAACESLYVAVEKNSSLGAAVPATLPFQSEAFAPKNDHLVDNRTAIVYFPEYCDDGSGGHVGEIVVMLDTTGTTDKYYWVIAEPSSEESKDPYDDNNKLKKDFDLTSLPDSAIIVEVGAHPSENNESNG
jgi:hypothetical protein